MKTNLLQITGALVLLGSVLFALLALDSADAWIVRWVPFVILGAGLTVLGTILRGKKARTRRDPPS